MKNWNSKEDFYIRFADVGGKDIWPFFNGLLRKAHENGFEYISSGNWEFISEQKNKENRIRDQYGFDAPIKKWHVKISGTLWGTEHLGDILATNYREARELAIVTFDIDEYLAHDLVVEELNTKNRTLDSSTPRP